MVSKGTQIAVEEIIKVGTQSGLILLKQGTTAEAAKSILQNAVEAGLAQIPENPTIQVGGQAVEVELDALVRIVGPWIEAGIAALVDSLSPASTEIVVGDGVDVQWVIRD